MPWFQRKWTLQWAKKYFLILPNQELLKAETTAATAATAAAAAAAAITVTFMDGDRL